MTLPPSGRRRLVTLILSMLILTSLAGVPYGDSGLTVFAQDDVTAPITPKVSGKSSNDAPAAKSNRELPSRKLADANAAAGPKSESFLAWMRRASGPIGLLILVLSVYMVALVVWMYIRFRKAEALPPRLIRELGELLQQKAYTDAYQRLGADGSFLGRTLSAGVRKLPSGYAQAQKAMELANEDVTMEMEHRTTYLATVGTLGPMIGLVGTVYGMILSFQAIATAGVNPEARELANGISTALFATLEGVSLSIPAIYFYAVFRNRISRLSLEVALVSEGYLEQFAQGIRSPHPLATSSAGPNATNAGPNFPSARRSLGGPPPIEP